MQQIAFRKKSHYLETSKHYNKQNYHLPLLKAKKKLQQIRQKQLDSPQKSSFDKNNNIKLELKCSAIQLKNRSSPIKIKNKFSMINFMKQNILIDNINKTSIGLPQYAVSAFQNKKHQNIVNPQQKCISQALFQSIPQEHIMQKKQQNLRRKGEIIAFYTPTNQYVALYPVLSQNAYPSQVPNLLPCLGIYQNQKSGLKYYVGQMYQQQSLKILIRQFGCLKQTVVTKIIRQLVITIFQLHRYGYSHNRINSKSIYFTTNGTILLNMFHSTNKPLSQQQKNYMIYYFAPEMLLSKQNNGKKNDIWAIGCLTLELLSSINIEHNAYHPYNKVFSQQNMSESMILIQQIQSKYKLSPSQQKKDISLSVKSIDFILRCMQIRIQNRPSAQQLLQHPFLKQ